MLDCHQSQLAHKKDPDFCPLAEIMQLQFRPRGMQAGIEAAEAFHTHLAFKRGRAW